MPTYDPASPKNESSPPVRREPKGPRVAKKASLGVLFVLTTPPEANVVVRNESGVVDTRPVRSDKDGEFRVELPPGLYEVEVMADDFLPFKYPKKVSVRQSRFEVIRADLVSTKGTILINSVEPDAVILIDGKKPANVRIKEVELQDVPDGTHTLRIEHPNIVPFEKKIEVKGGKATIVDPVFTIASVTLAIRSEPEAAIYIDGMVHGKTSETGEYIIQNIKPGPHKIKAVKTGYVPNEQTKNFNTGKAELDLKLTRFSTEFSDVFADGIKNWVTPKTWRASSGKVEVSGPGIGLLSDKVYGDFRFEFLVSLRNGKGAVWVVRARDEQNYYMFQLSGPKAARPNTFRSFICKNGTIAEIESIPVVEDLSRPGDLYTILVEASGDEIKHSIRVRSTPRDDDPQPLGSLLDRTFCCGTVGFGTKDGEEATVHFVNIRPLD